MPSRSTILVSLAAVVFLGSVIGIGLAASTGDATGSQSVDDAGNSTVQVTSSAEVSAAPDRAVIRPAVVATAETADDARAQVAENASSLRETFEDLAIDEGQVETTYYDIRPITDGPDEESEVQEYRAAQGFEMRIDVGEDDLGNRTGAIVDAVVGNGSNQIDSVQFTLSEDRREELRGDALTGASDDARAEAEHLATLNDLSITGVGSVSTGDGGVSPFDASVQEAADGAATSFDPGPVTVSADVTVTYRAD